MPNEDPQTNGEVNRLLRALPAEDYHRLTRLFEPVSLQTKHILFDPDEPIDYVYFLREGVVSLLTRMHDGSAVEVATVGNEGMIGVGVIMDAIHIHLQAMCQVPAQAVRIKAAAFCKELGRNGALHRLMHRYTQALMIQFTQGVACNRLHSVEERCARWLLMTHDRVGSDTFPLTQEFLAQMLGVRRASVTVVAGMLQDAGLIRYSRGTVVIQDRARLEKASCECYEVITREMARLTEPESAKKSQKARRQSKRTGKRKK